MRNDVQYDFDWSAKLFREYIWPLCYSVFGGGELLQMEGRPDSDLAKLLDIKSGIDAWQAHDDGMCGIASRCQVIPVPYNSFTIRMHRDSGTITEYEKRKEAITTGRWLYPYWTVQAYAKTKLGPVLSVGIAKTADIIDFIDHDLHETNRTSNASFAICYWDSMLSSGYAVEIIGEKEIKEYEEQERLRGAW